MDVSREGAGGGLRETSVERFLLQNRFVSLPLFEIHCSVPCPFNCEACSVKKVVGPTNLKCQQGGREKTDMGVE